MGFIIDKYQVRYCGIVAFAVCALAFAVFAILTPQSPIWLAYFAACFAGATTGGTTTIQEVLWANYFGRLSLGAIRTIAMPFSIIFSAGGPFFAGWAYDRFGNYQLAFGAFSACLIVGLALLYVARAPKKKALNPQSG